MIILNEMLRLRILFVLLIICCIKLGCAMEVQ